jgi:division protein CdvB (Snf7/Vps24/ESCRT-III family)
MSGITPEKKRALDEIEASLHRMAMKVLEAPASEREAVYETMRQSLKDAAGVAPVDKGFEEQYMTWLRALVRIIESGGGAKGGTA